MSVGAVTSLRDSYFKVLNADGCTIFGKGPWPLPNGAAGKWVVHKGELIPCESGLHLCRASDLVQWIGPTLYIAEQEGEIVESDDKIVCRKVRLIERVDTWNERTARLFAVDCAERVLQYYESQFADDRRPRKAIEVARRFANGDATKRKLLAARSAADSAAYSAFYAKRSLKSASEAAYSAARSAARSAVQSANAAAIASANSEYCANSAEDSTGWAYQEVDWDRLVDHSWQTDRLFEYLEGKVQ